MDCSEQPRGQLSTAGGIRALNKLYVVFIYNSELMTSTPIGDGLHLPHPYGIVINRTARIGAGVTIYHQVTIGANDHSNDILAAEVGDNVYIGSGAKIIGHVIIGNGAKIGANAVVTRNVPAGATVVGANKILLN